MTAPFARKRFGQHFLVQPGIAERIVELAALRGDERVLEIGPGRGALTALLAARCARLVLVEVDRDLAAALRTRFAGTPHVELIEGDVLRLDLAEVLGRDAPATVIANLPYNISTPVLMQLLGTPELFGRLVLMLQREVAERLCAAPGGKTYGALSVVVQAIAEARIALRVPARAFAPVPKVESAVVVITPRRPPPLDAARRRALRGVVRTAFARRRKQLVNVIAPLSDDPRRALTALGLDPRARPETLTPAQFVQLADALDAVAGDSETP
ncbi:ribosomal RNA small subunit methyltransferase A [bacterium]|nr:ribosomal RNA small subunit methyltransferase A [bacterium]